MYTFFNTILSLSNNVVFHLICTVIPRITQVKLEHLHPSIPITSTFIHCSQTFMHRKSKTIQCPPFLSPYVSVTNSSIKLNHIYDVDATKLKALLLFFCHRTNLSLIQLVVVIAEKAVFKKQYLKFIILIIWVLALSLINHLTLF